MNTRDARKLAVAILGGEEALGARSAKKIAAAYLDLLRATDNYWRASLPYEDDPEAHEANEALRAMLDHQDFAWTRE